MRLVADDDRVGAGDLAGVAHEPLVGLDGDRAVGGVLPVEQRPADALAVAAVAQLAVELVDEVAAVGEDQDAAGARGLDEAERGDRLAGAGRVLEPEALGRVGVLGLLGQLTPPRRPRRPSRAAPPRLGLRLLVGVVLVVVCLQLVVVVQLVVIVLVGRGALDWTELVVLLVVVELVVVVGLVFVLLLVGGDILVGAAGRGVGRRDVLGTEDLGRGQQLGRGRRGGAAVAVAGGDLRGGEQCGKRSRQRVDLVG